ncbi:hypothetical protein EC915_11530 [Pseudomonas sp. LP_7_YM]|nr:hypothetical protein EC915_11530 [Pseudomonas sp. LP_7_YM]
MGANERPPYPHVGSPASQGCSPKAKRPSGGAPPVGLAVSSSVLEPDGSFPAWTFGANCRTRRAGDQQKLSRFYPFLPDGHPRSFNHPVVTDRRDRTMFPHSDCCPASARRWRAWLATDLPQVTTDRRAVDSKKCGVPDTTMQPGLTAASRQIACRQGSYGQNHTPQPAACSATSAGETMLVFFPRDCPELRYAAIDS